MKKTPNRSIDHDKILSTLLQWIKVWRRRRRRRQHTLAVVPVVTEAPQAQDNSSNSNIAVPVFVYLCWRQETSKLWCCAATPCLIQLHLTHSHSFCFCTYFVSCCFTGYSVVLSFFDCFCFRFSRTSVGGKRLVSCGVLITSSSFCSFLSSFFFAFVFRAPLLAARDYHSKLYCCAETLSLPFDHPNSIKPLTLDAFFHFLSLKVGFVYSCMSFYSFSSRFW